MNTQRPASSLSNTRESVDVVITRPTIFMKFDSGRIPRTF